MRHMKRWLRFLLLLLVLVGTGFGSYTYGERQGVVSGEATVAADRSAFLAAHASAGTATGTTTADVTSSAVSPGSLVTPIAGTTL